MIRAEVKVSASLGNGTKARRVEAVQSLFQFHEQGHVMSKARGPGLERSRWSSWWCVYADGDAMKRVPGGREQPRARSKPGYIVTFDQAEAGGWIDHLRDKNRFSEIDEEIIRKEFDWWDVTTNNGATRNETT
jgi:hypothetical protein